MEQPQIVKIAKIIDDCPGIKTFEFTWNQPVKPGQFIMLWVPGVDEMPLTLAYQDGGFSAVTVCNVGPGSAALHRMKVGDKIGIRGPYGTWFDTNGKQNVVMVAGGYGAATCYFLTTELVKQEPEIKITYILGARSKDLLLYVDRLKQIKQVELQIATNDGSVGHKGYNIELLESQVISHKSKIDGVYSVGPEPMMYKVAQICQAAKIDCQVSVERYMKCGIGVCGSCCVDDEGFCMCKEGPIVSGEQALIFKDFGQYHRDATGAKVKI